MDYGEPWRLGKCGFGGGGGAVVTDEYAVGMHCCGRPEDDDLNCRDAYGGWLIFESCTPLTAERILLCVNALAGVSNDSLRAHIARGGYARSSFDV